MTDKRQSGYECWLGFHDIKKDIIGEFDPYFNNTVFTDDTPVSKTAFTELAESVFRMSSIEIKNKSEPASGKFILLGTVGNNKLIDDNISEKEKSFLQTDGFIIKHITSGNKEFILISSLTDRGLLYGVFAFLRKVVTGKKPRELNMCENPSSPLRMINNWDNMNGSIERGYAGRSFYFDNNEFTEDFGRIKDYARMLASVGINGVVINNVNVGKFETLFITKKYLGDIKKIAGIFREYGIRIYLSINYASPIVVDNLPTADPLDPQVKAWWKGRVEEIYKEIPDFGGFLVKADSEFTPGPFTYKRNHAEGANMLASALEPYGGIVIWRCFVYNCVQDWRDKTTDRARAAYDNFTKLDGQFMDNVVLQIKNGPLDFQVREPVHPLFGGLSRTNYMMEFQIAQEYTGQQRHVCYLGTMWKEILEFDTFAKGADSKVKDIVTGIIFKQKHYGFAAVVNTGTDENWTGHDLAQANLYAYGRLSWNPDLDARDMADEWIKLTFGSDRKVIDIVKDILMSSWSIYEKYTAPLGIGWMVNPGNHNGPSVDGYEYSKWGTYHRADIKGIGVDRTVKSGTGYAGLYHKPNSGIYEDPAKCPDELILFFHHLPYDHVLKSGKTVIEHIYDIHFEGVTDVEELIVKWQSLKGLISDGLFERASKRFAEQLESAKEWRDVINSYFYRKTGIGDKQGRKIYF
jgi:alpha-glucuronidase